MMNHTSLQGRLTCDPETRTTQSGTSVCSFTVAWSEKYKETETQLFLDCTAWRNTANFVGKYFVKGQEIAVEGKLHTEKWEDKNGNNRTSTKLTVAQAHFCGPKQDGASGGYSAPNVSGPAPGEFTDALDDSELPF